MLSTNATALVRISVRELFSFFHMVLCQWKLMNDVRTSSQRARCILHSCLVIYSLKPILQFQETIAPALLWSLPAGIIWGTSFLLLILSIDRIGLSRSNQWKNLQGPVGVILSLIILAEYSTTNAFFAVLAG